MTKQNYSRLLKEISSEKAAIRKKAMSAFKSIEGNIALPMLIDLLQQKNDDVLFDITKIILSYKDEALPYLVEALTSENWNIRKSASHVLVKIGGSSLKKLMEMIPENEEDVDFWMVQTLSNMGGEAIHYLVRMFKDPNQKMRIAAIRAAQNVNDPRMVQALLHLLEDQEWPIRKAAYDSLEKIHTCDPKAVAEALKTSSNEAKFWVIKLLAKQANPDLIENFSQIVDTDPMESKLEAIKALAMIETPQAHRVLVSYLAHKSWIIRNTAADAIWAQGIGVSEELLSAIKGTNVDARYWSVKLLAQTKEPKVLDELIKCLQDSHASVRSATCGALGSFSDKRALPHLMAMLNDDSEEVRTAAILAISQIGEKEEIPAPLPAHLRKENTLPCVHCGKQISKTFTFCPFCLGHLRNICPKCSRMIEPSWKGCPDCGTLL